MYRKILVTFDGSKLAECVLPHVEFIARAPGVENVVFLRVVEPFRMPGGGYAVSAEDIKRMNSNRGLRPRNTLKNWQNKRNMRA